MQLAQRRNPAQKIREIRDRRSEIGKRPYRVPYRPWKDRKDKDWRGGPDQEDGAQLLSILAKTPEGVESNGILELIRSHSKTVRFSERENSTDEEALCWAHHPKLHYFPILVLPNIKITWELPQYFRFHHHSIFKILQLNKTWKTHKTFETSSKKNEVSHSRAQPQVGKSPFPKNFPYNNNRIILCIIFLRRG